MGERNALKLYRGTGIGCPISKIGKLKFPRMLSWAGVSLLGGITSARFRDVREILGLTGSLDPTEPICLDHTNNLVSHFTIFLLAWRDSRP